MYGLNDNNSEYYIRNSTFYIFKVVVPLVPMILIQYDSSSERHSNGYVCCGGYNTEKKWAWNRCVYEGYNFSESGCEDCPINPNISVEKCE